MTDKDRGGLPNPQPGKPPKPIGGGKPDHGLVAIDERGEHALTLRQLESLTGVAHDLEDRQGIRAALMHEAAFAMTVIGIAESYLARKVAEGVEVVDLNVLRMIPAYLNAAERILSRLDAMTPKGSAHADELKRVQDVLSVHAPPSAPELDQDEVDHG